MRLGAATFATRHGIAISPTGWQPDLALLPEELRALSVPTLLIWGEHDPLGGADIARRAAATMPHSRLELVSAGHGPWLGDPDRVATLVSNYLH
jgi:pimeloyl-ACP methyl ester carboxylesterase